MEPLLTILVVGFIAGWLGGLLTKGRGFGIAGNIIVGVIGALLGTALFRVLGLTATHLLGQLIAAVVGAVILVSLLRFIKR